MGQDRSSGFRSLCSSMSHSILLRRPCKPLRRRHQHHVGTGYRTNPIRTTDQSDSPIRFSFFAFATIYRRMLSFGRPISIAVDVLTQSSRFFVRCLLDACEMIVRRVTQNDGIANLCSILDSRMEIYGARSHICTSPTV